MQFTYIWMCLLAVWVRDGLPIWRGTEVWVSKRLVGGCHRVWALPVLHGWNAMDKASLKGSWALGGEIYGEHSTRCDSREEFSFHLHHILTLLLKQILYPHWASSPVSSSQNQCTYSEILLWDINEICIKHLHPRDMRGSLKVHYYYHSSSLNWVIIYHSSLCSICCLPTSGGTQYWVLLQMFLNCTLITCLSTPKCKSFLVRSTLRCFPQIVSGTFLHP